MPKKTPGPLDLDQLLGAVDDGTLCRMPSPAPGPLGIGVGVGTAAGTGGGPAARRPAAGAAHAAAGSAHAAAAFAAAADGDKDEDPEIEALKLSETARKAAYALKKKHPAVKFTSGRRDKAGQARAMASNVVLNRKWIEQTYRKSAARDACQKWVDANSDKKTAAAIATGLLGVLNGLTDLEVGKLSKHLSGAAFDVQPVEKDADAIKATIRALAGPDNFLEKEGGLVRWHAQF